MMIPIDYLYYLQIIIKHLNTFWQIFSHPFPFRLHFSLEILPLQYIYAMVFALEEINHSSNLLPGLKLGYLIHDSCSLHPWAMQAALSLVGGNSTSCNLAAWPDYSVGYGEGIGERRGTKSSSHGIVVHSSLLITSEYSEDSINTGNRTKHYFY